MYDQKEEAGVALGAKKLNPGLLPRDRRSGLMGNNNQPSLISTDNGELLFFNHEESGLLPGALLLVAGKLALVEC